MFLLFLMIRGISIQSSSISNISNSNLRRTLLKAFFGRFVIQLGILCYSFTPSREKKLFCISSLELLTSNFPDVDYSCIVRMNIRRFLKWVIRRERRSQCEKAHEPRESQYLTSMSTHTSIVLGWVSIYHMGGHMTPFALDQ